MIAVIFEVYPTESGKNRYLQLAESLKDKLLRKRASISQTEELSKLSKANTK